MKFSDLTSCPFCGNEEFYTIKQIKGKCIYNERFDGTEAHNYGKKDDDFFKFIEHFGGHKAYCNICGKYLGNRTKDTVSIEVEKLFKRNGV